MEDHVAPSPYHATVLIGSGVAFEVPVKDPGATECGEDCGGSCADCSERSIDTSIPTLGRIVNALAWGKYVADSRHASSDFWREATASDSFFRTMGTTLRVSPIEAHVPAFLGAAATLTMWTQEEFALAMSRCANDHGGCAEVGDGRPPCPPPKREVSGPFGRKVCVDCPEGAPVAVSEVGYICGEPQAPPPDNPPEEPPWWPPPDPPPLPPLPQPEEPKEESDCCCKPAGKPVITKDETYRPPAGVLGHKFKVRIPLSYSASTGTVCKCRVEWHEWISEAYERFPLDEKSRKKLVDAGVSHKIPAEKWTETKAHEDDILDVLNKDLPANEEKRKGTIVAAAANQTCTTKWFEFEDAPKRDMMYTPRHLYIEVCVRPCVSAKCPPSDTPVCAKIHQHLDRDKNVSTLEDGDELDGPTGKDDWPVKYEYIK